MSDTPFSNFMHQCHVFYKPSYNVSLVNAIKLKTNYSICRATMLYYTGFIQ
jgi:hypothetical protein